MSIPVHSLIFVFLAFLCFVPSLPPCFLSSFLPSFLAFIPSSFLPFFLRSFLPSLPSSLLPSSLPPFLSSILPSLPSSFLPCLLPSLPSSLLPSKSSSVPPIFHSLFLPFPLYPLNSFLPHYIHYNFSHICFFIFLRCWYGFRIGCYRCHERLYSQGSKS